MTEDQRVPFGQRTSGVLVIQGLIAPAVGAVIGVIATLDITQSSTGGDQTRNRLLLVLMVAASVAVAIFLVISLAAPKLRTIVWGWAPRAWAWVRGLSVMTGQRRADLEQSGYDRRSTDLADERERARQPIWRFDARDAMGEHDLFWLNNHGHSANDVRVTCDPELFITDGDVGWSAFSGSGPIGGSVGSRFKGYPTERGRDEGVTFTVNWIDDLGDANVKDIFVPSKEIRAGHQESLLEAEAAGRAQGRQDLLDEQERIRADFINVPRWSLSGSETSFTLWNRNCDSVALAVRLEPVDPLRFSFESAAQWPDLTAPSDWPSTGHFQGRGHWGSAVSGVEFEVSWTDAANDRQKTSIFLDGWEVGY